MNNAEKDGPMKDGLIVLGAGPKGVALAAKRAAMRALDMDVPDLVVIDGNGVGAHWSGDHGYSDGSQALCTPPLKDVGFPYPGRNDRERELSREMLRFSWQTFLVTEIGNLAFADWVDRGQPSPEHTVFRTYLEWVSAEVRSLESPQDPFQIGSPIESLSSTDGKWIAKLANGDQFEGIGLVVTGPGSPREFILRPEKAGSFFDGSSFWTTEGQQAMDRVPDDGGAVCVIGTGETAGAVVTEFCRRLGRGTDIHIISRTGIVYTRGESYDENRRFSTPSGWNEAEGIGLSKEARREFIRRTDRSVFSVNRKSIMDRDDRVEVVTAEVSGIKSASLPDSDVCYVATSQEDAPTLETAYDMVVDATGFCAMSFSELLDDQTEASLLECLQKQDSGKRGSDAGPTNFEGRGLMSKEAETTAKECISHDLSVAGFEPRLYLPMLADLQQGPGFPNLTSLGILSDRILTTYCS